MEKYDVVIVGAGPAGLKAAEILAGAGKDVLVLEKNDVVGPKVCAGAISTKCRELGIPDNIFERTFNSFHIVTPHRRNIAKYKKDIAYTLDRASLGAFMKKKAIDSGAIVRTNSRVTSIESDHIVSCSKKIKYNYLIGADGSLSTVRKYLNLHSKRTYIAIQYIINQNADSLEFCFNPAKFRSLYTWMFPHKNTISIGVGARIDTTNIPQLRRNLDTWCMERGINLDGAKFQAATINCDYRGFRFGNIYLTGDAAGLAFGFSGEGIYSAILSGKIAAQSIIDKGYDYKSDISKLLKHKRIHDSMLSLMERKHFRSLLLDLLDICLKTKQGKKLFLNLFA